MGAAFAAALLLAFSPLILFGILDDFFGNVVRHVNEVRTSTNTAAKIVAFVMQFFELKVTVPWLMLILGLSSQNLRLMRRLMLTWVVAVGGILFYRPVHPLNHDYLDHPLRLVGAVCLAVLVHMVLKARPLVPSMKKLGVALALLGLAVPSWPFYANPRACYHLMRSAARGRAWADRPLGYGLRYHTSFFTTLYPWNDYSALLAYLRKATRPDSRIANLTTSGLAVHGAVGRLSVFMTEVDGTGCSIATGADSEIARQEQGESTWDPLNASELAPNSANGLIPSRIAWAKSQPPGNVAIASVDIRRANVDAWEQTLARQLEQTPNSVVVWNPSRSRNRLGAFEPVVLQYYEPEAQFGEIEVWRRKSGSASTPLTKL